MRPEHSGAPQLNKTNRTQSAPAPSSAPPAGTAVLPSCTAIMGGVAVCAAGFRIECLTK